MLVNREFYIEKGHKEKTESISSTCLVLQSHSYCKKHLNEIFMAWLSFSYPFMLYARAVIPKKLKAFSFTETEISTKVVTLEINAEYYRVYILLLLLLDLAFPSYTCCF